ncbi:MAG: endonuclease [Ferruginibacter sp.]
MFRKCLFIVLSAAAALSGTAQTNPAAQTLPFSFSSLSTGTLPAGMAMHRLATIPTTRTLNAGTGDLAYAASSTAGGWREEGANGVSMLASGGTNAQAGGCIVSVNTTGLTNIQVQWTIRVILQQASRDNSIALQYRIGTSGNFTDIGTTTTFSSTGQANGASASFTETLPVAAENKPEVQIRWIYWESAGSSNSRDRLAIDDISIAQSLPACTAPAAQPTGLSLTPATLSVSGSFSAAVPAADGYLVVRSLSSSLSNNPVNGTSYTAGQTLGNGTIVQADVLTSFTDNGLASATLYYYYIFSYNNNSCSGGPAYLTVAPLTGSVTTLSYPPCTAPSAPPANLSLTAGGTFINGSFTAEPTANNYLVVYSTSSSPAFIPANGTTYTAGQVTGGVTVAYFGTATSFFISGLTNLTTYYVFVYAASGTCAGEPFYNTSSLNGSATTTTGGPPPGYYDAAGGLTCQNLKTALRDIITTGQVALSYGSIDDIQMPVVDTIRSDDGSSPIIWDIYSNNQSGPEPFTFTSAQNASGGFCVGGSTPGFEGGCWNKEHTFPRSWFKLSGASYQQPTEADLFIVRPTDSKINGNRANIPYSMVSGTTSYQFPTAGQFPGYPMPPNPVLDKIGASTYPGVTASSAFEPNDAVKGDLARAYFYVLTRYQNELANWVSLNGSSGISTVVDGASNGGLYPSFQLAYLLMMYNWHTLDPVDARETRRNDLIYSQQNNRNPYIDHPEYVALVWQCTGVLPVTLIDFTATRLNDAVLLRWQTTYETSFREYQLERSTDGISFAVVGTVPGKNLANYSFTDSKLPQAAVVYYRLRMVDRDGKYKNSKVVPVRLQNDLAAVQVYPNPSSGNLTIELPRPLLLNSQLLITDLAGRLVKKESLHGGQKMIAVDVSALTPGRYFIRIANEQERIQQSFTLIR